MNPVHCHCLLKLKYLITPQCVNKLHDQNIAVSMKLKMKNWPHMQITDPKSAKCQFAVVRNQDDPGMIKLFERKEQSTSQHKDINMQCFFSSKQEINSIWMQCKIFKW